MAKKKGKTRIQPPAELTLPGVLSEADARRAVEEKLRALAEPKRQTAAAVAAPAFAAPEGPSASRVRRVRELAIEKLRRDFESVKLYEPGPTQQEVHRSNTFICIVRGGNQSGKTTVCLQEFARAVTGRDPHGKYPKKNGIAIIVGFEEDHCSTVIYPRLFRADGSLMMIRDEQTRRWRAYREWQDAHRKSEARPAPPLIPPRMIRKIAWKNPAERVFSVVYLTNGWEIRYYSSTAEAPQGFAADLIWIDEDIKKAEWIGEMLPRLAKRGGRLIWSALPKSRNLGLYTLSQKAWAEVGKEKPDAVEFVLRFRDNEHIGADERRKTVEGWAAIGADELRMRDAGEYVLDQYKVFPEFSMSAHGFDATDLAKHPEYVTGSLPSTWCRYAVIDPGYQVCAVLFLAVPPAEFGDYVYLEDELYLRNCSDRMFGEAMAAKTTGKSYRAFIIDLHGSARSESNGLTIRQQYSEALRMYDVRSEATGHGFLLGEDNKAARIMAVHMWLAPRGGLPPKLRVPRGRLPNFLLEMEAYMKKRTDGGKVALDEPDDRKNNHLMHCLQYAAAFPGLVYAQPGPARRRRNPVVEYFQRKLKKKAKHKGQKFIHLGAGEAA